MAGFNSNLYFALKLSYRSWEKSWRNRDNKTGISNNENSVPSSLQRLSFYLWGAYGIIYVIKHFKR